MKRKKQEREKERFLKTLGFLDVNLHSYKEKPLKVNSRGEEFLMKRNLPGQRVGAKARFDLQVQC